MGDYIHLIIKDETRKETSANALFAENFSVSNIISASKVHNQIEVQ